MIQVRSYDDESVKMRTARSRKKDTRQRGNTTHGFGSMKKNRGAGNRGGRGSAGSGKRGDANKQYFRIKKHKVLGKYGFNNGKHLTDYSPVNIYAIENSFDTLKSRGLIKEHNGSFSIDLARLGFNKLLGTGKPTRKYEIDVEFASQSAIDKISGAGGKVNVKQPAGKSGEDPAETPTETKE